MAKRSKKIKLIDDERINKINSINRELLKKYKIDMNMRNLSNTTIYRYETDIQGWLFFILDVQDNKQITQINEDDITEYLSFSKEGGNSVRRLNDKLTAINNFLKFLRKKKIINENPTEFIDRGKHKEENLVVEQTYLTEEQINNIKIKLQIMNNLQLECYFLFSLTTMARVNAVSNVTWSQINIEDRTASNVIEKEGYKVTLFFTKETGEKLKQLKELREKENIDCDYVFITRYGGCFKKTTTETLWGWAKKIGELIGISSLHSHDFRHSYSTILKNRGMSLEDVSKLLNHKSTDVTLNYYIKHDNAKIKENKDKYDI